MNLHSELPKGGTVKPDVIIKCFAKGHIKACQMLPNSSKVKNGLTLVKSQSE